jgi:hypothetical protein
MNELKEKLDEDFDNEFGVIWSDYLKLNIFLGETGEQAGKYADEIVKELKDFVYKKVVENKV